MYIGYTINVLKNRQAAKAIKNDAKNTKKRLSKDKDYILDDPTEIQHVDEALKLLTVMTGDFNTLALLHAPYRIYQELLLQFTV